MRDRSWFRSEAAWTVAAQYVPAALGALALLAAAAVGWPGAGG